MTGFGCPVPRITPCATSCIKRFTPTSRSRLINVCEEHTSTASSIRLDRPSRPTLVRKGHQDIIAYPSLFRSASSAVDLHRNCKATINDALRSRQRLLGGNLARCECTVNASLCQALRISSYHGKRGLRSCILNRSVFFSENAHDMTHAASCSFYSRLRFLCH